MEISSKTQKEAKKSNMSVEEMAVADLVACGWSQEDAYITVSHKGRTWDASALKDHVAKIASSPGFIQRVKDKNRSMMLQNSDAIREEIQAENADFFEKSSKEYTLRELIRARDAATIGSPDWLKINQQIIEVTQMKRDEIKEEDTTIHFFLPLRCYQCSLYEKEARKKEKGRD